MRKCSDCEYFRKPSYGSGYCHFNPPTVSGDYQSGRFADTSIDDFCSKWEPKWDENDMINKAWDEFLLVVKLSRGDKE